MPGPETPIPADLARFAIDAVLADSNHVVVVLDEDFVVRWASPSMEQYGLRAVGWSMADLVHPEDLSRVVAALETGLPGAESSLMSNTVVSLRAVTPVGVIPCDASGRWVGDATGRRWMVASLHDVRTRYAIEGVLRALAAGADEHEAVQAVITASHDFGGVRGAQVIWRSVDGTTRTFGDLGAVSEPVFEALGEVADVDERGQGIEIAGSDWGYVLPISSGEETLGSFALWGIGPTPNREFVNVAVAPLLDLAALALLRAREQAELHRQATTDLTTGLLNRHAFFGELNRIPARSAVMYLDLDDFKDVNDQFGHTIGDRLLSVVGKRLSDAIRDNDQVGRIGGDEFAVLCRGLTEEEARIVGERIIGSLNQTFIIDGNLITTGASIGIAYTTREGPGRQLLDHADQALMQAKAEGKGQAIIRAAS